ncbi:ABC transporter ATP-binding protein [Candidatus Aerophobetes bacterium]|uniref:ABC transporter ATP-binding protein n=1 Tax=Aerophobetes bacterium TaxID=2030807 RepID=A0A523VZF2_UNCAE|nr:MAG: ABC transporter ATP-binding protein [Candidatus Aerophobetes bacterium]
MNKMIKIVGLKKSFDNGKIKALDGIDLEVAQGEFISIMGPSGSGKSTLLNMIAALDTPDAGDILVEGKSLLNEIEDVASYRARTVGFIFQLHNLLPHLTALENILIPMFEVKAPKGEKIRRAQKLLEEIGLKDRMRSFPPELSGGERQKVAIARALANNPKILLADEPTGNIDSKSSQQILRLFKEFRQRNKVTMILVTHDSGVAETAERIVHISDGRISS